MNNPFVRRQAVALAGRVRREAAGDEARVRLAYRLAYARDPRPEELARALGYLKRGPDAWPDFAQAILASNEFQYLN